MIMVIRTRLQYSRHWLSCLENYFFNPLTTFLFLLCVIYPCIDLPLYPLFFPLSLFLLFNLRYFSFLVDILFSSYRFARWFEIQRLDWMFLQLCSMIVRHIS